MGHPGGRAAASALVTAVVLLPEVVGLDRTAPWPIVTAFRRRLALGAGALAAGAAVRPGPWRAAGAGVGLVAAAAVVLSAVRHRARTGEGATDGEPVSVLGANVWIGRADPVALGDLVRCERPDVVVLLESGDRFRRALTAEIDDLGYRGWSGAPGRAEVEAAGAGDHACTSVLVAPRLGDVTARAVTRDTASGWIEVTGGGLGDTRVLAVHPAVLLPRRTHEWRRELARLAGLVADDPRPTVVVGDLNATLDHRALQSVLRHLRSASAEVGRARVGTWPAGRSRRLGVAIDHVLVSAAVGVESVEVLDVPGSDHRALLARLRRPRGAAAPRR
ncbi:endonuclease/exonuclease/phosphatase family protein [Actinomycetospora termitidis]|uniref:Endonuclease/exonuclease/phosphatase family protein n=1 Tax=Actinomycetospora termitidis TaxID=3053470 RepID=A0ABT7M761_9PSEU|nr:endonuclease/exonuclease/phosphatase family protein [Actinomycetospora sp. Odt1-22]MDL5156510.1 endonuclease/exonuclease/phosphatase family protein [Actinomycetospora sp. Odt1-22]